MSSTQSSDEASQPSSYFRTVLYYPNDRVDADRLPADLSLNGVSAVIYAFATVQASGTVCVTDQDTDCLMPFGDTTGCLAEWRRVVGDGHVKLLLSIGGEHGGEHYPTVASDPRARELFAVTARALIDRYDFDGVDIWWKDSNDCDYIALLAAMRAQLPPKRYMLTCALPGDELALNDIDLPAVSQHVDFVHLRTYDYFNTWLEKAGHHARLHLPKDYETLPRRICAALAVHYAIANGLPARKILLGIPTFGQSFPGATESGDDCHFTADDVKIDYRDLPEEGAVETDDLEQVGASCVGGAGGWVSYDNQRSVAVKAKFVKENQLGGMFYWHACSDRVGELSLSHTGSMVLAHNDARMPGQLSRGFAGGQNGEPNSL